MKKNISNTKIFWGHRIDRPDRDKDGAIYIAFDTLEIFSFDDEGVPILLGGGGGGGTPTWGNIIGTLSNQTDLQLILNSKLEAGDLPSDAELKVAYENNANTNAFTDAEKIKVGNTSGNNTGDENTASIQTKRPLKTIDGNSLEGSGNIVTLGGSSNPNEIAVTTEAQLSAGGSAGKILCIQADITLTGNITVATNATIKDAGGSIILDGNTLTGDNTSLIINEQELLIDCITGDLAGTWNPPTVLYVTNFGAVPEAFDSGNVLLVDKTGTSSINVASTPTVLTDATANFTGREGQKIVVLNGGNDTTYSNSLITTISSVTNATTVVLADAVQNVGSLRDSGSNGLDDLTVSGTYTGTRNIEYRVEIDGEGTPDTFRWSKDKGLTWEATGVAITGSPQLLELGVSITFAATTGHDGTGTVDGWFVYGYDMTNARAYCGTDNYNAVYQALRNVRNQKAGELIFPQGHYMTNTIKRVDGSANQQDGWLIGDGQDNIIIKGQNSIIQTYPFDFDNGDPANEKRTDLFAFYKTVGPEMHNLTLKGSYYSRIDLTEYPAGVNFQTGTVNPILRNVHITQFQGDGIVCSGDGQLENGIQGTNKVGAAFDTGLTVGRLLSDGSIDTGQTNYVYSTDAVLISGGNFDDFNEIAKYGHFSLTGDGGSGWAGLTFDWYDAIIYDANDNFVAFLSEIKFYDHIRIQQSNWKKIRVCFKDVTDKEEIDLRLRADFNSIGVKLYDVELSYNGRQGLSNGTSNFTYNGGFVHDNGGVSPGYGLDFEDHRRAASNIRIENVTFRDNDAGDLAFIGTENVTVTNCFFKRNTRPYWGNAGAIYGTYCRDMIVTKCTVEGKEISGARNAIIRNIKFDGGSIDISGTGCVVSDIDGKNYKIKVDGANSDGHNKDGMNSTIRNVVIHIDNSFDFILADPNVLGQWENIKIILNSSANVSNLINRSDLVDAGLKAGQVLWSEQGVWQSGRPYGGGYIDGFIVDGNMLTAPSSTYTPYARFPQFESMKNVTVDAGITLGYYAHVAANIVVENLKCSFLDIDPRGGGYNDSDVGVNPVWTFKNLQIINEADELDMSSVNFRFLQVEDYEIDVVFEDSDFLQRYAYAQTLNRSVYFEFDNYGKVIFKGKCVFQNEGSEGDSVFNNIDLSSSWCKAAHQEGVRFEDIELLSGQTIILENSDDYVAFTKANSLMPTYATFADDAAAATANYPQHYWYMTSTGELRVKL